MTLTPDERRFAAEYMEVAAILGIHYEWLRGTYGSRVGDDVAYMSTINERHFTKPEKRTIRFADIRAIRNEVPRSMIDELERLQLERAQCWRNMRSCTSSDNANREVAQHNAPLFTRAALLEQREALLAQEIMLYTEQPALFDQEVAA